ncbi:hypothetical protein ABIC65_001050 [Sphingomonas trueperi]|uniref:hypothetical protein n=1 Tax=Sphingomonas trueperi TaxID=53317 RepID=UPI003392F2D4
MARNPLRKFKAPSAKQTAARNRNWRIWKLRGLYWNSFPMSGERLEAYRAAIDAELVHLGAEPETERRARLEHERDRYETFRAAVVGDFNV